MDTADDILLRLFRRHFPDPLATLERLNRHLESVELPFDLKTQIRESQFPPFLYPTISTGHFLLPSTVYYFLPGSGYGTHQVKNSSRTDAGAFLSIVDGLGLNFGCPVRLLRALDALSQLEAADQVSPRNDLKNVPQHFCAVEELLWITGWRGVSKCCRGGCFSGLKKDVDWCLHLADEEIYLEAKYRPSDWAKHSDGDTFEHAGDGFLAKAVGKFTEVQNSSSLHLVGITTTGPISDEIINLVGTELEKVSERIHAVLIRSEFQTCLLSTDLDICHRLMNLLEPVVANDFPTNHYVAYNRHDRDLRVQTASRPLPVAALPKVWALKPAVIGPPPYSLQDPHTYRAPVVHVVDGEPFYSWIPRDPVSYDLGDCHPSRRPVSSLVEE
jgi:hypothetical protein